MTTTMTTTILSREQILAAQDLASEEISVPEWGGSVRVRMMTGAERDALGASLLGADKKVDMSQYRIRLLAACLVDEAGQPLFGPDEVGLLGAKSGVALDRVYRVAERLNDVGAGAVEAAQGN
jgi:hypothetical protein